MALFQPTQSTDMVFVERREWKKTETSKPMVFITLADAKEFERFEFIADKDCNTNFASGDKVIPVLRAGNYNNRASFQLAELHIKQK
jgi:hypothetical protein